MSSKRSSSVRSTAWPEAQSHYEDRPRLLEETHEAFERLYLEELTLRCAGLRRLRGVWRS